jgi:two-component system invasion response regulator UvrY
MQQPLTERTPMDARQAIIKVVLADDHPVVRQGLRSFLEANGGFDVAAEAASGAQCYSQYRRHRPDVVIMDISMPGYSGLEAIRRILAHDPAARILVLTVHDNEVLLGRALAAGAMGFVTKGSPPEQIAEAIRSVAANRIYVSSDLAFNLNGVDRGSSGPALDKLSPREFEIFQLLAQGNSVGEVAAALSLSSKTVSNHFTHIKQKLGTDGAADLARLAIRHGLLEP